MILDQLRAGVETPTAEETKRWGTDLCSVLPSTVVLALHGDLGVGKTTFVQGLAIGFGIVETVNSPTFTIFNIHRGMRTLVHLDAYRLSKGQQMDALMLEDFLTPPYCLAVEWPENITDWLPDETLHLDFSIVANQSHRIQLRG